MPYNITLYMPYHTIPHHTVSLLYKCHEWCHMTYNIISYYTISYHTILYHTIPYNSTPYRTMPYHNTYTVYVTTTRTSMSSFQAQTISGDASHNSFQTATVTRSPTLNTGTATCWGLSANRLETVSTKHSVSSGVHLVGHCLNRTVRAWGFPVGSDERGKFVRFCDFIQHWLSSLPVRCIREWKEPPWAKFVCPERIYRFCKYAGLLTWELVWPGRRWQLGTLYEYF